MRYYSDDIIKIEDFDLDSTLTDEKSYENILAYNISYKSLINSNSLYILDSIKQMDLLKFMMELIIWN